MANYFVGADLIERLAWTLVHSLWQGAFIALVAAGLRVVLASAQWRYGVSAAALIMMLAAPAVTFTFSGSGRTGPLLTFVPDGYEPGLTSLSAGSEAAALPWPQWIVLAWLAGVGVCMLRLLASWHATRKLVSQGTTPAAPGAVELVRRLSRRLPLHVPVRVLQSVRIDTPVVIGWLRPVVLLPAAAVTGLTPAQLEAVLAHELAHVRRHDYLVNVIQRCIESLLFYHPAVWWLSAKIRADREECCDDVALASCRNAATYARALLELERARSAGSLAMAGTGGDLTRRVQRLLQGGSVGRDWRDVVPAMALVAVLLVTAFHGADRLRAQPAADEPLEPPPAQESPVREVPPAPLPEAPVAQDPPVAQEAPAPQASPMPAQTPAPPEAAPPAEPPAPGAAPMPEEPPVPGAPAAQRAPFSWVLLHGETTVANARSADVTEAQAAQARLGADVLWFRNAEGTYVIRDPQLLQTVAELHRPLRAFADQQAALGEEQRRLAEEMRNVRVEIDMQDLEARLAELAAEIPTTATQRELGELQRALGELQRELGRLQEEAGREQGRIGRLQGEFGRRQAELGQEQAYASRRFNQQVRDLIQEAMYAGIAILE